MALIKCKECDHEISTKAEACPNCGAKQSKPTGGCTWCLAVLAVGFLVVMIVGMCSGGGSNSKQRTSWQQSDNSIDAYIKMKDYVELRLKSPKSAEFPGVLDGRQEHVTSLGNHTYRIRSYVDAQNSFGALIRTHFSGEIKQISERNWQLVTLELY